MRDANIDESAIARLLGVIGGDQDDLLELLNEFFVVAPDNLLKMERAAASGNLDTLRIASHSLKSNGRDFGAVDLANLCQRLEQACKSGAVSDAVGQVAAITDAFAAAKASLKKLVAGNE
ncbi:Hpt domain-containing protein [Frigidibacter sp. RF13]|uniref:Hpt domain-containing protein n=1 Tax=Frigidibacter sp. RF13 TaxID=2997340 RepID=UPI00226E00AC|nr:Hpt domain-containing protein [Frigidibacter sp. RF13]MCY1126517.1 Hpt domain-containing protein [Frigidibacter sp. RF13]